MTKGQMIYDFFDKINMIYKFMIDGKMILEIMFIKIAWFMHMQEYDLFMIYYYESFIFQ